MGGDAATAIAAEDEYSEGGADDVRADELTGIATSTLKILSRVMRFIS